MKIYDESGALLDACDLSLGYLTTVRREVSRTPAHLVVMPGTDGLRRRVPEKVEYEAVQIYHPYTEDELAAMQPPSEPDTPATDIWAEMAAAYNEGVNEA